jgi:hypothetical protein
MLTLGVGSKDLPFAAGAKRSSWDCPRAATAPANSTAAKTRESAALDVVLENEVKKKRGPVARSEEWIFIRIFLRL